MTSSKYNFVKTELEREAIAGDIYLAGRMLPNNFEQLKAEYLASINYDTYLSNMGYELPFIDFRFKK